MRNKDPLRPFGNASLGELLCTPYLDTDTTKDTALANAELANRGCPRWLVAALRKVCAVGLWPQLIIWEEYRLGFSDVAAGYGLMFLGLGIAAVVLGNFAIPKLAIAGLIMLPIGLCFLGLALLGWRRYRRRMDAWLNEHANR